MPRQLEAHGLEAEQVDVEEAAIDKVEGAWVKEQKVKIKDGKVSEYRVVLKVRFVLKD